MDVCLLVKKPVPQFGVLSISGLVLEDVSLRTSESEIYYDCMSINNIKLFS